MSNKISVLMFVLPLQLLIQCCMQMDEQKSYKISSFILIKLEKKLYICSMKWINIVSSYSVKHLIQFIKNSCLCDTCKILKGFENKKNARTKSNKPKSKKDEVLDAINFIEKKNVITKKDKSNLEVLKVVLKTMS